MTESAIDTAGSGTVEDEDGDTSQAQPTTVAPVVTGPVANPLRDPRDRRIPRVAGPCVLVIFGVTGDLARKKLMPAIYDLANRGLLPPGFSLVGFARRDWEDEDFAQVTYQAVKEHARTPFRDTVWEQLSEGVRFVPGEFTDDDAFDRLADTVAEPQIFRFGELAWGVAFHPEIDKDLLRRWFDTDPALIEATYPGGLKKLRKVSRREMLRSAMLCGQLMANFLAAGRVRER